MKDNDKTKEELIKDEILKKDVRLQESEERFRTIFERTIYGILLADVETKKFIEANTTICEMLGYSHDEILGIGVREIHPKKDLSNVISGFDRQVRGEVSLVSDIPVLRKDGTVFYADIDSAVISLRGKQCLIGVFRDITGLKKAEDALRLQSEIVGNIAEGIYLVSASDLKIVYANRKMEEIFGYGPGELVGKHVSVINAPTGGDPVQTAVRIEQALSNAGAWRGEVLNIRKDGTTFWGHATISKMHNLEYGDVYLSLQTDITERKKAEEKLLLYARAIAEAMDGIQIVDLSGHIIYSNKAIERIYGFSTDELKGRHVNSMNVDQEFAEAAILPEIKKRGRWDGELMVHHKDGRTFPVWLSTSLVRDDGGNPIAMVGIVRDITDQKKAEEQLRSALREKEILLRELHHRTKNNMQVIKSLIDLEIASVSNKQDVFLLNDTKNRIMSMALAHEKLYGSKDLSNVNLNNYIEDLASALLKSYQVDTNKIVQIMEVDDMALSIDTVMPIGLIINELITNTLKYAFPGNRQGEIRISAHFSEKGEIEITYGDNGIGFPAGFDFRKTDSLGLQIVYNLVKSQLRGHLTLNTDEGSKFVIVFKEPSRKKRI